ncbi:MAG: YopX family protein [Candidatus Pacearchaeota archaeon]
MKYKLLYKEGNLLSQEFDIWDLRGWDLQLDWSDGTYLMIDEIEQSEIEFIPCIGWKDKNGKNIFKYDIVKVKFLNKVIEGLSEKDQWIHAVITYNPRMLGYTLATDIEPDVAGHFEFLMFDPRTIEIIGNWHQNLELRYKVRK